MGLSGFNLRAAATCSKSGSKGMWSRMVVVMVVVGYVVMDSVGDISLGKYNW